MDTRIDPDAYDPDAAKKIRQLYRRTRLAADRSVGRETHTPTPYRDWGNPSPEMLTGGLSTSVEMEDCER